jgi:hypothetical protein
VVFADDDVSRTVSAAQENRIDITAKAIAKTEHEIGERRNRLNPIVMIVVVQKF